MYRSRSCCGECGGESYAGEHGGTDCKAVGVAKSAAIHELSAGPQPGSQQVRQNQNEMRLYQDKLILPLARKNQRGRNSKAK
jgi:hypothetical protein